MEEMQEYDHECVNFMNSKIGDLASVFFDDGYYVFVVRSYLWIGFCKNCGRGKKCKTDHLLEAIIVDAYEN